MKPCSEGNALTPFSHIFYLVLKIKFFKQSFGEYTI